MPVDPEGLVAKAAKAVEFGYRQLAVVEGQQIPSGMTTQVEIHRVPADPKEAITWWLSQDAVAGQLQHGRFGLARALKWIDRERVEKRGGDLPAWVEAVARKEKLDAETRAQAWSLIARFQSHQGAATAIDAWNEAERILRSGARIFDSELAQFFDTEWWATTAIVRIDNGDWQGEFWDDLDRKIDELSDRVTERERRGSFLSAGELAGLMFCRNARSTKRLYQSRLEGQRSLDVRQLLFAGAVEDRLALATYWDDIWRWGESCDRQDTNAARQENYLLECLATAKASGFDVPDDLASRLYHWADLRSVPPVADLLPFDRIALWRWLKLTSSRPAPLTDAESAFTTWLASWEPSGRSHAALYVDLILIELLGLQHEDPVVQRQAVHHLVSVLELLPPSSGMLALLRLRSNAVVGLVDAARADWAASQISARFEAVVSQAAQFVPGLPDIASVVAADPSDFGRVIRCCPY